MKDNEFTIDDISSPSEDYVQPQLSIDDLASSNGVSLADIAASSAPSFEDQAKEVGIGTAQGAIEGGGTFGGAVAAARVAAAITPPVLPIVGPFAKPIAGTLGFGVGLAAGYNATKDVADLFPEVPREDLVPYREGGKTFGESIGAAPIAFGIPVMQGGRIARFVSGIGEAARKYPKSFLASEIMGGLGAGVLGGVSEATFPGQAGPRVGAEVVGGFFSPARILLSTAGALTNFTKSLVSSVSPSTREGRAATALYNTLNAAGTDIPALIKALEVRTPDGITPTAAQKTGDRALTMLETTLARGNSKYGAEIMEQGIDSIRAYERLIERLRDIGSPEALVKVAELRAAKTDALLEGRLALADADASAKIARITKDTPQARANIGQIVRSETERALADARTHENALYEAANKASVVAKKVKGKQVLEYVKVRPSNTAEAFLDIATSMTPERLASSFSQVSSIMGRLGIDKEAINRYAQGKLTPEYLQTGVVPREYLTKVVTAKPAPSGFRTRSSAAQTGDQRSTVPVVKESDVKELQNIRSDILALTREAAASGKTADTHFYGKLAEAALDDLDTVSSPAFNEARQFSRQLNDFFSRTYANEIQAVSKTGAEKLPAEVLVAKAFGSGADVTAMRMNDIEQAVGMMGNQYDVAVKQFGVNSPQAVALKPFADASRQGVVSVQDAQARAMRLAAAKAIDPITGRINPTTLQRFVNENERALLRLNIIDDLRDTVKAENAFRALQTDTSRINKTINKQAAFAQVLRFENPTAAVTDALNSRYPVRDFKSLVRLAKSGGPEAVEGLKASVYDYAFTKAGGDNKFSPAAFNKALFQSVATGQPSLYSILHSQDAMSLTEAKNLRRLVKPMERIETALKNNQLTDEVVQGADAVTELVLRASGAKLGAALAPGSSGSLVAASAGSKFLRKQFDKMPTFMVKGLIQEATQDPQLMALLLRRGATQREKFQISRQIHAYTVAAGLNYADADNEPMPVEEAPRRQAKGLLQRLPTVQTRGTVVSPRPAMPAPGGASGPPAPVGQGTSSRKMLQSLFPQDTISAME